MEDLFITIAAFTAVILPVFNVWAYWILRKASRTPEGRNVQALQERTHVAAILTVASLLLGAIGINRIGFEFFNGFVLIGNPIPLIFIAVVVVLISLPSMIFLKRYFKDGFGNDI